MLHTLELGPTEQNIVKQHLRTGEALPERIMNAPSLLFGLEFYLQAFFDLDSERSQGMGLGRIPWSAITRYALHYALSDYETDELHYLIRAMDVAHLKRVNQKE